jgi:hypothetical protein
MFERLSSIQDKLAKTPTILPEDIFSACPAKFSSTASQPHDRPGIVSVDCVPAGPNNELRPSGTLLSPGAQAGPVLQALVNAMQELQRKPAAQVLTAGSA